MISPPGCVPPPSASTPSPTEDATPAKKTTLQKLKELTGTSDASVLRGTRNKKPVIAKEENTFDLAGKMKEIPAEVEQSIWENFLCACGAPTTNNGTFSLERRVLVKGRTPADPDRYECVVDMPVEIKLNQRYWRRLRRMAMGVLNFSATLDFNVRATGRLGLVWTIRRLEPQMQRTLRHLTLRVTNLGPVKLRHLVDFTALFANEKMLFRGRVFDDKRERRKADEVSATLFNTKSAETGASTFTLENQRSWHRAQIRQRMEVTYECEDEDARVMLEGLQSLGERLGTLGMTSREDIEMRIDAATLTGSGVPDEVYGVLSTWDIES